MRLFGIVNGAVDRFDRGPWMLSPFTLAWASPVVATTQPAALLMGF